MRTPAVLLSSSRRIQTPPGGTMNLTTEHLADILIGIARSQNALIDALERISPGFHNMHAMPLLNIAANTRVAEPRMIDFPARILLRLQGRVALENAAVKADLERLMSGAPTAAALAAAPAANPGRFATPTRGPEPFLGTGRGV